MREHGLDDLEFGNILRRVEIQKQRCIVHLFFDAKVEHDTDSAVQFHGVYAYLEDLLGGKPIGLIAQALGVMRLGIHRATASLRSARTAFNWVFISPSRAATA